MVRHAAKTLVDDGGIRGCAGDEAQVREDPLERAGERLEVTAIGGRVEVATRAGEGTTFTLYLPLTLAVTQAVLVRAGASVLAGSSGATPDQSMRSAPMRSVRPTGSNSVTTPRSL